MLDDADESDHFNCTIQELKRFGCEFPYGPIEDFNCTIQELKCIHYTTPKN